MNRRGAGIALLLVATILHSTRYLSAAIFGSGLSNWNRGLFATMLQYVGPNLAIWGYAALGAGVAYLVWGEIGES